MAKYRQILESLGISEEKPKNPKPGDVWKTKAGNWYGMRKSQDGGPPTQQGYLVL